MDNIFDIGLYNSIFKSRRTSAGIGDFYKYLMPLLKAYEMGLIEDYVLKQAISYAISQYVEDEVNEIVIKNFEEELARL